MRFNFAHLNIQGVNVAVFDAKPTVSTDEARSKILDDLTESARRNGLRVDKSALAYRQGGRVMFFGTPDLVRYLEKSGVPGWTHNIEV